MIPDFEIQGPPDRSRNTSLPAIWLVLTVAMSACTAVPPGAERDGGDYSVNQPASVSFKYQLIHVPTGTTLCLGVFDETQQTLLSNLFSFSKASSRGFKWVKAEQLAREGLHEKLNDCRYLAE